MCVLYDHLVRQKEHAQIKAEIHEVERYEREICLHVEKCVVCRSQSMMRLNEFFGGRVIVVEA